MSDLQVESLIRQALAEDIASGDVTTLATVPAEATGSGWIVAREPLVVAGSKVAARVFQQVDAGLRTAVLLTDGDRALSGDRILQVEGSLAAMLRAERTALNFLQRLSGIATLTRAFVDKVAGARARILDTRKTTPGLRILEKQAVRAGGGHNHRFGLYDGVLVKDNHIAAAGGIAQALTAIWNRVPHTLRIQVEVETLEQLDQILAAGVDAVLLDNMEPELMAEAVRRVDGRLLVEASGGITLDNVKQVAATGVDLISVGTITHSARAMNMNMEMQRIS